MYNAKLYINECIESVLSQDYPNTEIIVINDGSTDGCEKIVEKYLNVKVITQKNGGVTSARRTGVQNASGEWIMFVDADDTIDVNMLSSMASHISEDTDLIIENAKKDGYLNPDEMRKSIMGEGVFVTAPFQKLYKRLLFSDLWVLDIPRSIVHGEDALMLLRLSWKINKKIHLITGSHYNYRTHSEQTTKTFHLTSEYEKAFNIALFGSFPSVNDRQQYKKELIYCRLTSIELILLGVKYTHDRLRESIWYKELLSEIKDSGYKPTLWHRIVIKFGSGYNIRYLRFFKEKFSHKI